MAIDDERKGRPIANEPPDPAPPAANGKTRATPITPHAPDIEAGLLGIALLQPAAGADHVANLDPDRHFYVPANAVVADAIRDLHDAGADYDLRLVEHHLAGQHLLERAGGSARLLQLLTDAPPSSLAGVYAQRLRDLATARTIQNAAQQAAAAARNGDTAEALTHLAELDRIDTGPATLPMRTLREFLDVEEDDHDWAVPGLLERTDRLLLTGPEGGGKSTLLRQIAVQVAAGIHPFTLDDVDPLNVLLLDLENSERHIRRQIRPLHIAGHHQAADRLHIAGIPQGLDLLDPTDAALLGRLVEASSAQLVVGGPVYKLVGGSPVEEEPARAAAAVIDRIRARHGTAFALETHQPHENGGKRPERPYGASLWKRWPEFGLHLSEQGHLRHWRGDRDVRDWPSALRRGGEWPWTAVTDQRGVTFARILEVTREHGQRLSLRELEGVLAVPKTTIERAIKNNQKQFDALCEELEE